jgi:glutathione S-transferase
MTKAILHHCAGARSFRCLWALEEAGFDAELRMWKFPPRWLDKGFKAVNPLATIPAWEENGHLLTESAAICQRIAMGTSLEVLPDEPDYLPYLNWLHRSDATLTFPLTIVLRYTQLEPAERKLPQAVEDYKGFFLGRARSIEAELEDGRQWLVGGRFTVADICVGYAIQLGRQLGADDDIGPLTNAWFDRLAQRPAYQAARAKEKQLGKGLGGL